MIDAITDMWDDGWAGRILLILMLFIIALIPIAIYGSIKEAEQWEAFRVEHNCKIVGKERGHTSTGIAPIVGRSGNGGVGIVITTEPDKTGWACDDGITYWR